MRNKSFPCPICKGSGISEKGDFVDVGIGMVQVSADWPCGYCGGEAMIEIGGKTHMDRKAEKIGLTLIKDDKEYSMEEIRQLGYSALQGGPAPKRNKG